MEYNHKYRDRTAFKRPFDGESFLLVVVVVVSFYFCNAYNSSIALCVMHRQLRAEYHTNKRKCNQ